MIMKPHYLLFLICFLTGIAARRPAAAQNLNGEKIQVAADALTVLRFNSEIKRYELGNRDGYTCQVRGNDNSIVIKTIADEPASTNLVVTEGKKESASFAPYLCNGNATKVLVNGEEWKSFGDLYDEIHNKKRYDIRSVETVRDDKNCVTLMKVRMKKKNILGL